MKDNKTITVSAPGKLMILGEHAVVYGYPCLAAALDKYLTIRGKKITAQEDSFITGKVKDTRFVKAAINVVRDKYKLQERILIEAESELGEYGLGSSAAVTVATVKLLDKLFDLSLTKKGLFNLSYEAILQVQKKASGFDVASCIFGGTIYFDGKSKKTEVLLHDSLPIVVGFSGNKADTVTMIKKVAELKKNSPEWAEEIFGAIGKLVEKGKEAIVVKNWQELGKLMNENQKLLIKLGVSNDKLDKMVNTAIERGAFGAKLSGAGGGDCIIALVSKKREKKVKYAIQKVGGKILDIVVGTR